MRTLASFILLSALLAAGCANQPRLSWGKHLVYRDAGGAPVIQVDYPSESFCRRVEAVATPDAKCEPASTADVLRAQATLRYNPPDVLVLAHYQDLAACRKANSRMAPGVHLEKPCTGK